MKNATAFFSQTKCLSWSHEMSFHFAWFDKTSAQSSFVLALFGSPLLQSLGKEIGGKSAELYPGKTLSHVIITYKLYEWMLKVCGSICDLTEMTYDIVTLEPSTQIQFPSMSLSLSPIQKLLPFIWPNTKSCKVNTRIFVKKKKKKSLKTLKSPKLWLTITSSDTALYCECFHFTSFSVQGLDKVSASQSETWTCCEGS